MNCRNCIKIRVPLELDELFFGFEFLGLGQDGDIGENDCNANFDEDLGYRGDTSMGRKKSSWLAWTYLRHLRVEKAACRMRIIATYPSMC